jgi:ferredoxin--NADP+ reductase
MRPYLGRRAGVTDANPSPALVAVVGAGPAGLFAARLLANAGHQVVLFNRDLRPGGLAEYGIYPDKFKMKDGLRKQFAQILSLPNLAYYGNLAIGEQADFSLAQLRAAGFQAILATAGAQGTKWLNLPGEELTGVYHAKDIVYHYNGLPPFSHKPYQIGKRVAIVGVGNVMMDIAHWLVRERKVDEVVAIARRGPAEVKFTKKEMENVARNLDLTALEAELGRVAPVMQALGQDVAAAKDFILAGLPKALEPVSATRFRFEFLASPARILGGESGQVRGLEVDDTTLSASPGGGEPQAKRLGTRRTIDIDTIIFCIGDKVDENFGLPVLNNAFVKHPQPRFPVEGNSYEAYHPDLERPVERCFVAGWSREASNGLVGVARKDGENGGQAVLQYLQSGPAFKTMAENLASFTQRLARLPKPVVTKDHLPRLYAAEQAEAERRGLEAFKYSTNEEMLKAMGL